MTIKHIASGHRWPSSLACGLLTLTLLTAAAVFFREVLTLIA